MNPLKTIFNFFFPPWLFSPNNLCPKSKCKGVLLEEEYSDKKSFYVCETCGHTVKEEDL